MDHQKIIKLRHQASDARELREKALVSPDVLDELLEIALEWMETQS